ncbi:MAG: hypothetical protein ABW184_05685 [Sphingobium sp.]
MTALHAGLFQEQPWRLFLTRLRARTEADLCRVLLRPAGDALWSEVDSVRARLAPAGFAPQIPPFGDLRPGRVYAGDEVAADAEGKARHLRVVWPDGGDLAISLLRAKGDFRGRDASLLASLAPHLKISLRSVMEMERARRRTAMAEAALARFATGWMLIDARGQMVDCDASVTVLIEQGRVMRRAGDGRLRLLYPQAEALLEDVLAQAPVKPRAAWLAIDPAMQVLALPTSADDGRTLGTPHCLILLRTMQRIDLGDGRHLASLFRLTRSEAALTARIAAGASLAEAADALGLTIETARNYSKRIFVKTGARGQADLVRIVVDGVSMLG